MTEQLQPTPISAYRERYQREQEGKLVTMPSGMVVRLRPLRTADLIRHGHVPALLAQEALNELSVYQQSGKNGQSPQRNGEDLLRMQQEFVDLIVKGMYLYPKIVADSKDDSGVTIDMIPPEDQAYVQRLFDRGFDELRSFRPEPAVDVDAVGADTGDTDAAA